MPTPVAFSPFDYTRDDERRQIHVVARRTLDTVDFAEILRRQVDERTWSYGLLYDLRRQSVAIAFEDSERLRDGVFRGLTALGPRGPVAFVAWSADVLHWVQDYGTKATQAGMRVQVFTHVAEAQAWLEQHLPQPV